MKNIIILEPSSQGTEEIRGTFRNRMEKWYNGWSDEFDKQWDDHSFHFAYKEGDTYLATCRLILKRYNDIEFSIPMEQADISNYKIPESYKKCVEGGMVSFSSIPAIKTLMLYTCTWLIENKFDYLVTCYDVNNQLIKQFYHTLGLKDVEQTVLKYSGFTPKQDKEPVRWQVVVGDLNRDASRIKEMLSKDLNTNLSGFTFPSIEKWLLKQKTIGKS